MTPEYSPSDEAELRLMQTELRETAPPNCRMRPIAVEIADGKAIVDADDFLAMLASNKHLAENSAEFADGYDEFGITVFELKVWRGIALVTWGAIGLYALYRWVSA